MFPSQTPREAREAQMDRLLPTRETIASGRSDHLPEHARLLHAESQEKWGSEGVSEGNDCKMRVIPHILPRSSSYTFVVFASD